MNQAGNSEQDPLLELFKATQDELIEFYQFLLDRECGFLEACEPKFATFVRGIAGSNSDQDTDTTFITTESKLLLKRKPQEWVKLLQETSDILVGLRHLGMVLQLTNTVQEETKGSTGVVEFHHRGESIEFLFYTEQDVIYRILSRLKNGLDRLVKIARRNSQEALQTAESLRASVEDWSKEFKNIRGSMTHKVNFGVGALLENRAWEAIAVTPHKISPSDIEVVRFGEKSEEYCELIREEAGIVAKGLLELYPMWRELLDALAQPSSVLV